MFGWTGVIAGGFGAGQHDAMTLAAAALAVGTLGAVFVALRGRPEMSASSWLIVAMATVLADPHLFFQDTVILAPIAVAYLAATPSTHRAVVAAAAAGGWAILWFEPFMSRGLPVNIVFGLYLVVAMACVLAARRVDDAAVRAQALAA
jgi:hypothetical protein